MTVEAFLTHELRVRFIDARTLATEAKLKLGVDGYNSEEHEQAIIDEALNIFQRRPDQIQAAMRRLGATVIWMPKASLSYKIDNMNDSSHTASTSDSTVDTEN